MKSFQEPVKSSQTPMKSFQEVLARFDRLWEQAEDHIEAYFAQHRRREFDPAENEEHEREKKNARLEPLPRENSALLESVPREGPGRPKREIPDLKELNTAVTILKRIQDARRAIHLDAMKLEVAAPDGRKPDAIDPEKISRILRRLEQNGDGGESLEDDADAV